MISFGATADIFEFNTYEAIFWLLTASCLFLFTKKMSLEYRQWLLFSALNIFIFGVTDIVEIYTGGFLHTAHWLLYWKIIHVIGLVVSIVWYLYLRLRRES